MVSRPTAGGALCCGSRVFQAARAASGVTVSKVWGSSFWPGTLNTRVPAGIWARPGAPGASSTVKANTVPAATPGFNS